ncbi:MAG: DNA-processing protein DprA [Parachlamydiaceae bacterium]
MNENEAFFILSAIPGLGANKIRHLVDLFGSAAAALSATAKEISAIAGCEKLALSWKSWEDNTTWEQELTAATKIGIQLIPFTHPLYPKSLRNTPDHPALLYVQGDIKATDNRSIAVVGTRESTSYGNEMAASISEELAANGFSVISGLARGIDTAAHRGALNKGRTIAVIGSGLSHIYPTENEYLAQMISKNGAVISEFSPNTPPSKHHFPQRNRIVSGMSLATVLIEAPLKGGAMLTMDKALSQGKKLFALPGLANSESFRGNHSLIKTGKAELIENGRDIIAYFEGLFPKIKAQHFENQGFYLDNQEQRVLELMPFEEIDLHCLSGLANLPVPQIYTIVLGLIVKGVVKETSGKIYKKLAAVNKQNRHN